MADSLKIPPHSLQAEQAVIGGLMLDSSAWVKVDHLLVESDFYTRAHKLLFRAIRRLITDSTPVDVLTVNDFLETKGYLDEVGGLGYIVNLAKDTPSAANVVSYAQIVKNRSLQRQSIALFSGLLEKSFASDCDVLGLLVESESAVFKLSQLNLGRHDGFKRLGDVLKNELDIIEENHNSPPKQGVLGISSGFADLDALTSGLQGSDLIVVAGRPSMGKTSLVMNFGEAAAKAGSVVVVFSLEMSAGQIAQRMLAGNSGLPLRLIRESWDIKPDQWGNINTGLQKLVDLPMYIDDSPGITAGSMRSMLMRLNAEIRQEHPQGVGMVIVDYLQLMESDDKHSNTRNDAVGEISRALKKLAKEFNAPVLVLSQLNRKVEERGNKRPLMSDLRDSGAIEQDADMILFVYRDEVYTPNTVDKGVAEVLIGKQRNGPLGTVRLGFDGYLTRFRSLF